MKRRGLAPENAVLSPRAKKAIDLVCPVDLCVLTEQTTELACSKCGQRYVVQGGVVRFLEEDNAFYEGAYRNQTKFLPRSERWWQVWPLWLITNGYPWAVRRQLPAGSVVVELGCASGVLYFGQRYRMVGCDVSLQSLQGLVGHYERCVQADASLRIPMADASADGIVSSFFWEHVPPHTKPKLLQECCRVLRPGGILVFLYDVETDNPLIARYRAKDLALYRQLFIYGDGHVGYQTPQENVRLFGAAGLDLIAHNGVEKTWLQSPSVYTKLERYGGSFARPIGWFASLLSTRLFYLYTVILRIIDATVCPWLPEAWARIVLVVCKKR